MIQMADVATILQMFGMYMAMRTTFARRSRQKRSIMAARTIASTNPTGTVTMV